MNQDMRRRAFLRCFCGVFLSGVSAQSAKAALPAGALRRRVRFVFTIINPFGRTLEGQRFWAYLPADIPPKQRLVDVQSTIPFGLSEDQWGHRILGLEFDRVPPFAKKVVTVTAEVELQAQRSVGELKNRGVWLGAERFVESDHSSIQRLAHDLEGNSVEESARRIYDWVRNNLNYAGYLEEQRGALRALREKTGDCTEYADLVVALARAAGIPARSLGGYVSEWDFTPNPQDYHNWAELYINGAWHIVDAQKEVWQPISPEYVVFRIQRDKLSNPIGESHRHRISGEVQVR